MTIWSRRISAIAIPLGVIHGCSCPAGWHQDEELARAPGNAPDTCGGCDDQDPCTLDTCASDTCQHSPLDRDGDGRPALACGGNDCDDLDPRVHGGRAEGPAGAASCADAKDNDCDGRVDGLDSECQRDVGLCGPRGFCWLSPSISGNQPSAGWASGPDDAWIVGLSGTVLRWDGLGLSGVIWPEQVNPTYPREPEFTAVWGSGPDDVWIGSDADLLLHWNGRELLPARGVEYPIPVGVRHINGRARDDAWAVTITADVLTWDGTAWSKTDGGFPCRINEVWSQSPELMWASCESQGVMRWDGSAWEHHDLPVNDFFAPLWGFADDDVWAGGALGAAQHWDGTQWQGEALGLDFPLDALWGAAPDDLWALGSGRILHWDGRAWQVLYDSAAPYGFDAMWGVADDDLWGYSFPEGMFHWDGGRWDNHPIAGHILQAMWGWASDTIWAVGVGLTVVSWNGSAWRTVWQGGDGNLVAVHGSSPDNVWAVGWGDSVARWDGTAWTRTPSPTTEGLFAVWVLAPDQVWAAGQDGMYAWDGEQWHGFEQPRQAKALWGSAPDNIWAFDTLFWHWNGGAWQPLGPGGAGTGIYHPATAWGCAPDDIWVGCDWGDLLHWDGQSWQEWRSGASYQHFQAVWCAPGGDVWLSGQGALLRLTR